MKVSVSQIIKQLFNGLPERQREILESRYGLAGQDAATLAAIGDKYHVTRERIRQLESLALKVVRDNAPKTDLSKFVSLVSVRLEEVGGAMREDVLVDYLQPRLGGAGGNRNASRFLLEVSGSVFEHREDDHFHTFWYLSDEHRKGALDSINRLHQSFKSKSAPSVPPTDSLTLNFVSISKLFATNPYGQFGLAEWSHVVPKNARDWAYLVMKKENRPMHFNEIAAAITKLSGKRSNPQTVHNELIKYDDFVLIGKGTYALSERGYQPGVAWEVIDRILRKQGPLNSREVIKQVSKERLFKENTVFINLQNKQRFKRMSDGRYTVAV